jgi:hypothetical protein
MVTITRSPRRLLTFEIASCFFAPDSYRLLYTISFGDDQKPQGPAVDHKLCHDRTKRCIIAKCQARPQGLNRGRGSAGSCGGMRLLTILPNPRTPSATRPLPLFRGASSRFLGLSCVMALLFVPDLPSEARSLRLDSVSIHLSSSAALGHMPLGKLREDSEQ